MPEELIAEIKQRYETLGEKYLTDNLTEDGRRINGMMYTSRIDNCNEEVVDAVFCIIGWIFKCQYRRMPIPDAAYKTLGSLVDVYLDLEAEKADGTDS